MNNSKYTISNFLNRSCKKYAKKTALKLEDGKTISYADMMWDISRTSQILKTEGIVKGDKVAMFYNNDPQTIETFFAITRIGAIAVLYPDTASIDEINKILETEKPEAVFIADNQFDKVIKNTNTAIINMYNNDILLPSHRSVSSAVYAITNSDLAATVYQINDCMLSKSDFTHSQIIKPSRTNISLDMLLNYAKNFIYPLFKGVSIYCKAVLVNLKELQSL